jgi:ketosteroid isomerase-like protein
MLTAPSRFRKRQPGHPLTEYANSGTPARPSGNHRARCRKMPGGTVRRRPSASREGVISTLTMTVAVHSEAEAAVLAANAAFYRAFSEGDFAAMSQLWAERASVACFHPTSAVLVGRARVLQSWKQILRQNAPLEMRCHRATVHLLGEAAFVTGYEGNGSQTAHLAVTNVFVLEEGRWRMVHHQAGPLSQPLPRLVSRSEVN